VLQGLVSTAHFVVAMENTTNPWCQLFLHIQAKNKTEIKALLVQAKVFMCRNCMMCNQPYAGQTVNTFSMRCSAHGDTWNKPDKSDDNDQMALSRDDTVFRDVLNNVCHRFFLKYVKQTYENHTAFKLLHNSLRA